MGVIIKKGVEVHYQQDRLGKYFIHSAFSSKRPPTDHKKAVAFYKKNGLGKRIDKVQGNNNKYTTISALRKSI